MSDIAIRVENLSKRYEIGRAGTRHDTLRDALTGLFRREGRGRTDAFWALRDVSFEVKRGEVVGIIGRNGAGKSTLLKVLSQITEPTSGRAEIHGRVGSLLEVGTGFHPELTGRENIYLNGAILGMRREEIARKFDEIVAFSEIEKFLDTPVKRYSSGMYVRLAFAVAAHLEPEILLVDEVLAVGDAAFQKKALGKMGSVVNEGRTVLFVSHNMTAIMTLCSRVILLQGGRIENEGPAGAVISTYMNEQASGSYQASALKDETAAESARFERIWFSDKVGREKEQFGPGEPLMINLILNNPKNEALEVEFSFWDSSGYKLWNFVHAYLALPPITIGPKASVNFTFYAPELNVRQVFVHAGLRVKRYHESHYVDLVAEGLRYLIEEPPADTYRPVDALFHCPAEFQATTNES